MTSFIKRLLTRRSQIPKLAAEIISDTEACALGEGWVEVIKEEILAVFDRAMGNKVFAALEELTKNPIECRGNTIKRLKGSKKHMWRYRIGDYRLLFIPLKELAQVLLVTFSHWNKVYAEKARFLV